MPASIGSQMAVVHYRAEEPLLLSGSDAAQFTPTVRRANMFRPRNGFLVMLLVFLPAILVSLSLLQGPVAVQASALPAAVTSDGPRESCSVHALKGTFGVLEQGTILATLPDLPPPPVAFSNVALATYDGRGHFSGTFTASDSGFISEGMFSGTYTVTADCTYSDQFTIASSPVAAHHTGAIVGNGLEQEIHFIYSDPGMVIKGTAKRTPPQGCTVATLKGSYVESLEGSVVIPLEGFPPPPIPAVETGVTMYDGAGNFTGTFSSSFGSGTGGGVYTVKPDCTCSIVGTSGDGAGSTSVGVITGEGPFQEIQAMFTVPWLVASGPSVKQEAGSKTDF